MLNQKFSLAVAAIETKSRGTSDRADTLSAGQLRGLLRLVLSIPLIVVVILVGILILQLFRIQNLQNWVQHSTYAIRDMVKLSDLAEDTQMQYLMFKHTNEPRHLHASAESEELVLSLEKKLRNFLSDNPAQMDRLAEFSKIFEEWRSFKMKDLPFKDGISEHQRLNKQTQKAADLLIAKERELFDSRFAKVKQSTSSVLIGLGGLALVVASLYTVFARRSLYRIAQSFESALQDERKAREESEKAIRNRDEFMSLASHELRTPLTSLKLQLQILDRQRKVNADHPIGDSIATSLRQVNSITSLVDDLLETSRIQSGRFNLVLEEHNLANIVREIVGEMEAPARTAGCTIETSLQPNIVGTWDRRRIEQIVANLLANAIKYAPQSRILVSTEKTGPTEVLLQVKDSGPGIPEDLHQKIFERFERGEISETRVGGLGLGLYIVKGIVKSKGGRVWVESKPGFGATFLVSLPLHTPNPIRA